MGVDVDRRGVCLDEASHEHAARQVVEAVFFEALERLFRGIRVVLESSSMDTRRSSRSCFKHTTDGFTTHCDIPRSD